MAALAATYSILHLMHLESESRRQPDVSKNSVLGAGSGNLYINKKYTIVYFFYIWQYTEVEYFHEINIFL